MSKRVRVEAGQWLVGVNGSSLTELKMDSQSFDVGQIFCIDNKTDFSGDVRVCEVGAAHPGIMQGGKPLIFGPPAN